MRLSKVEPRGLIEKFRYKMGEYVVRMEMLIK